MSRLPAIPALVALAMFSGPFEGTSYGDLAVAAPKSVLSATPAGRRDSAAAPRAGVLKTFGDWTVGCDNTLSCELRSLHNDDAPSAAATISVSRAAGLEGRISLKIMGEDADRKDLTAQVDGNVFDSPAEIVVAMVNAHALTVIAGDITVATISLTGVAAALRYVDAMQGRAGTVTALVAKGLRPASAVPTALPKPIIVAQNPGGKAATPSGVQIAAMSRTASCEANPSGGLETAALGGGKTLVLLPCSTAAYNLLSALFVLDRRGAKPVQADAPLGFAGSSVERPPVPLVVNGDWSNGVLTSYAKGRGLGDCGLGQEWVWDGGRLRLSSQSEMGECRGNMDFIMTWQATVVRR